MYGLVVDLTPKTVSVFGIVYGDGELGITRSGLPWTRLMVQSDEFPGTDQTSSYYIMSFNSHL
jgi:hypothetical protein